jgi:hypothetical protein
MPLLVWTPALLLVGAIAVLALRGVGPGRGGMRYVVRLEAATRRRPRWFALALFLVTAAVYGVYVSQGARHLGLTAWHDAQSNLLQTKIFASGRLYMPSPPAADDYTAIHVLVKPVYCSKYPIGYPLLMTVPYLLGHAELLMPLLSAGTVCLVFLAVRSWSGGLAGLCAALLIGTSYYVEELSGNQNSANASLFFAAMGLWSLGRYRMNRRGRRYPLLAGVAAGGLFICRPLDGLLLVLLVGVPVLVMAMARGRTVFLRAVCWFAVAFLPLASLQLAYNRYVFGGWATFGYHVYDPQYIGHAFGLHYRPPENPEKQIPLVRRYYYGYVLKEAQARADSTWAGYCFARLEWFYQWLYALGPLLGLVILGVRRIRWYEWWLAAAVAVVIAVNWLNIFNDERFCAILVPFVVTLLGVAVRRGSHVFGRPTARRMRVVLVTVMAGALLPQVASLVRQFPRARAPQFYETFHRAVDRAPGDRKLVILRYDRFSNPHDDVGYNEPDIQNAKVVVARDRGPEAVSGLLKRYSDRHVYIYYQGSERLALFREPRQ